MVGQEGWLHQDLGLPINQVRRRLELLKACIGLRGFGYRHG
ncbi:hypothetical protein DFAR_330021 [Desulfarculales bacterium]